MFECVALFTFIYFRSDQVTSVVNLCHENSREISETVLSFGEAFIYFDPYHVHCNKKKFKKNIARKQSIYKLSLYTNITPDA